MNIIVYTTEGIVRNWYYLLQEIVDISTRIILEYSIILNGFFLSSVEALQESTCSVRGKISSSLDMTLEFLFFWNTMWLLQQLQTRQKHNRT